MSVSWLSNSLDICGTLYSYMCDSSLCNEVCITKSILRFGRKIIDINGIVYFINGIVYFINKHAMCL